VGELDPTPSDPEDRPVALERADQRTLFALARAAIRARLEGRAEPELPNAAAFKDVRGVFVTLRTRDGKLRGCIGHARARLPLGESVRKLAVSAAVRDTRFSPLALSELEPLKLEISVLSPLSTANAEEIEIGTHGLMIQLDGSAGLLLPQVASERDWTPTQFLENTCLKAGLERHAWKDPRATLLWFSVDCYEEE